jgi:UDP-GlcNAc:undecaprenyl-phosphate GlcNAc-1-phosphate transferase
MTTIWVAFLLALLVSVVSTRASIYLAFRWGIVDRPDGIRKLHAQPTPYTGGVAVYLAFAAPLVALLWFDEWSTVSELFRGRTFQLVGLGVCATLAMVLGLLDDRYDLSPTLKLAWQIVIASVAFGFGFRISAVSNPLGGPFEFGVFTYPVTVFWFVGCMNAVNLLDGLDGLAAGTCLFVGVILLMVSLQYRNYMGMFLMASLSGATLGFLFYNFPPAKIFLGDSGSMLLGFLVAALSLVGASRKAEAAVALFVPVVALGVPILDTSLAIIRRWYKRLPIGHADRYHIHHILVAMGHSHRRAVLILYAMCVILGTSALLISFARSEVVLLVVVSLIALAFVCIRVFSGVRLTDVMAKLSEDKLRQTRSKEVLAVVDKAVRDMRAAEELEKLWSICTEAAAALSFNYAELRLAEKDGTARRGRVWKQDGEQNGEADGWAVRLGLRNEGRSLGQLVLRKDLGSIRDDLENPELLDRLRDEFARRLGAILPGAA